MRQRTAATAAAPGGSSRAGGATRRTLVLLCAAVLAASTATAPDAAAVPDAPMRSSLGADHSLPALGQGVRGAARVAAVPPATGVTVAAARARRAGIHWSPCPPGWHLPAPVRCGSVTVPLDYTHPGGPALRLAVDRTRATGAPRRYQGPLLYDPGGPGGSGLSFPLRAPAAAPLWRRLAAAYDLVGFDPRGVGRSAPVSCQDPREFAAAPKPDPDPGGEAGKRARRALARTYAAGCLRRTGSAER
jgi:hypothetical protein